MAITLDNTLRHIQRQAEEESAMEMAKRLGLPYASLDNYPFNWDVLSSVPLPVIQEKGFAVYLRTHEKIRVAVVHAENPQIRDEILGLAANWGVEAELTVVSPDSLKALVLAYLQLQHEAEEQSQQRQLEQASAAKHDYFSKIKTLEDLQNEVGQVSVTEIIDVIVAAAYNQQASDIHIEPGAEELIVRFRIDGVLQRVLHVPMSDHRQIVSRIKMAASLKLDDQRTSQDGRFSLADKGINADVRVSTIPTSFGEGIVMRILRQDMQKISIEKLGFSQYNQQLIEKAIHKPYGLILVTGPTGSGKSTTLYGLLEALNSPEKKIITLEDPVEYQIEGLQQSQVDPERGFSFAEGLRGALRQDPDIVMVGEIRDPETATIALNASLTGHLVLSTLHTNDAVTAPTRFLEMGIAPFLLNGSIQLIIAQRLVRQIVPGSTPEDPEYRGRIVVAEVLSPNQEFEQAVLARKDRASLEEIAVRGGMIPMLKDGLDKVGRGLTTEAEISRVTEL